MAARDEKNGQRWEFQAINSLQRRIVTAGGCFVRNFTHEIELINLRYLLPSSLCMGTVDVTDASEKDTRSISGSRIKRPVKVASLSRSFSFSLLNILSNVYSLRAQHLHKHEMCQVCSQWVNKLRGTWISVRKIIPPHTLKMLHFSQFMSFLLSLSVLSQFSLLLLASVTVNPYHSWKKFRSHMIL